MKKFKTINFGLDRIANIFLKINIDLNFKPVILDRCGAINSIELKSYVLKDGSKAKEYVQYAYRNEEDQVIYFIGLKTNKRYFDWPSEKITKKLKLNQ